MQIVHIVPGSGGSFYCGNCLRDSKYLAGLKKAGADVVKVPMYLPIFADEHDLEDVPVFYGAVSLYLKHSFPLLRKSPAWIDRLIDSGPVLKLAAGMSGSTDPTGLEDLTISMLMGESGEQQKELDHMVAWIKKHCKPDVIHLSNALLMGLAERLKTELGSVVVCTLQDEDVWVNAMTDEYKVRTWDIMAERAKNIDAFLAVSDYYAKRMQKQLKITKDKLYIRHITIDPDDYTYVHCREKPLNIGYISRMNECNGLGLLVDAFIQLKRDPKWDAVNLVITGGHTGNDNSFLKQQRKKINNAGLTKSVLFHQDFENAGRTEFFERISVLSVPVLDGEAFGLYLLESMASGVPVVQPSIGAFPEIIQKAGGGITYEPNEPKYLAEKLAFLLSDQEHRYQLSTAGREGVEKHFNVHHHAKEILALYRQLVEGKNTTTHVA